MRRHGHGRVRHHPVAGAIGRPRSAEADKAILEAATGLYTELGYDGLTVEGVAARAGVGKTTVYRRYPSKLDLVMAAAEHLSAIKGPTPDTGSLRGDLLELARGYRRLLTSDAGRAIPVTIAAATRNPELAAAHRRFIHRRRKESMAVIARGVERGELPADTDVEMCVDLVTGPLFYRTFVSLDTVGDRYVASLVDAVLRAAGATRGAAPQPGTRGRATGGR